MSTTIQEYFYATNSFYFGGIYLRWFLFSFQSLSYNECLGARIDMDFFQQSMVYREHVPNLAYTKR